MAQQVNAFSTKLENLNLIPWDQYGERRKLPPECCPLTSTHSMWHVCPDTHIHLNEIEIWLGMVAYIFNPSTLGMVEGGTLSSRSTWPT